MVSLDELDQLAEAVDRAIAETEQLDDAARQTARRLRGALEKFHKAGLTRIVRALKADPRGKEILFELVDEPTVRALFLMHGLVRADARVHATRALEMIRAQIKEHGITAELVGIESGAAQVRLTAPAGCGNHRGEAEQAIEAALLHATSEIQFVEFMAETPRTLIPTDSLGLIQKASTGWFPGPGLAELPEGKPYRLDVESHNLVVLRLGDKVSAFFNECAHQGLPLDGGVVDVAAKTITCPWHGFRFDCQSGDCLTAPQARLDMVVVRIDAGKVWVKLP